jgi:hypothetical protein
MAQIVAIFGMTHHPFYFRLTGLPVDQQPPFAVPRLLHVGSRVPEQDRRPGQAGVQNVSGAISRLEHSATPILAT